MNQHRRRPIMMLMVNNVQQSVSIIELRPHHQREPILDERILPLLQLPLEVKCSFH
jgi:hypothetical protein